MSTASRALALAVLALTIVACRDESKSTYVALGSSFAAGSGIAPESTACRRSEHSYPHRVAAELGFELDDRTCAGATTADVLAQVEQIDAAAALVTITVGGNDLGYTATAEACADGDCPTILPAIGGDETLRRSLTDVIDAVRSRAHDAVVVLATYPRIVPGDGSTCAALGLGSGDADVVNAIGTRLERVFVAVADATDVVLADPYVESGHDACAAPAVRWVAGADAKAPALPFHPLVAEHAAVARLVVDAIRGPR